MEVLTSILGAVVAEIGGSFCGSICSRIRPVFGSEKNVKDLEKEMKKLTDMTNDVKHILESAERNGRSATIEVKKWLRDVEEFANRVNAVQGTPNDRGFCVCLWSCGRRITTGKEVEKMLKEVETLLKASFPNGMLRADDLPKLIEYIPGPSIEHQTTASRTLAELVKALNNCDARRIGVWGMGGVGKTTLAKNLNNMFNSDSLNRPFGTVIWATVSKDLDLKRVQRQIAERLNLEVPIEDNMERSAGRIYQRLEKEKFLLILDDVWESFDLDHLGIPQPEIYSGSKILLTSRFLDVCGEMMTDVEVKVNTLSDGEAWKLFSQKAGEVASSEHVKPIAEAVARECCGLPLALIIVGTAMRGKAKVELWKHALKQMQRSVPRIRGVRDKVYSPLKWSYDSLEGNDIKACFLYCALYPEDFSIDVNELVDCWLAEGLIDEQQNYEDSVNDGIVIVETLKASCLLEDGAREGSVKMHDVVRDVAVWIASSLEHKYKSLSRSGFGSSEISVAELSDSLKRISLVNNKIQELPDCAPQCSGVSTLLLQDNLPLKVVPERFLEGFQALKVLNISRTRIRSLPPLQFHDLRALLLKDCFALEKLPQLGGLRKLQMLDLCATRIRELPQEMENLTRLKRVNLSYTSSLNNIRAGIVSKWTCLEVLDMRRSGYRWHRKEQVKDGEANFEELGCLKRLLSLSVTLKDISCLGPEYITWLHRVRSFEFVFGPNPTSNSSPPSRNERRVAISGPYIGGSVLWSFVNSSSLVLNRCDEGLKEMLEDFARSSVSSFGRSNSADSFSGLKSLSIMNCSLSQGKILYATSYDLLPNLEELRLENLTGMQSISQLLGHLGLKFSKLKLIEVSRCDQMKSLLLYGKFITTLPNVETIRVSFCYGLEKLFDFVSEETSPGQVQPIVQKLQRLELKTIPKLRILCRREESWPSLERVDVVACDQLVKLPLTLQNASTIIEIRGESSWWNRLEFDNENTKSTLQQYFRPYLFQGGQTEDQRRTSSSQVRPSPPILTSFSRPDYNAVKVMKSLPE